MRSTGWLVACWAWPGAGASRRASGPAGRSALSSGLASRPIRPRAARRPVVPEPHRRGDAGDGIGIGAGRGTAAGIEQSAASQGGAPHLGLWAVHLYTAGHHPAAESTAEEDVLAVAAQGNGSVRE